MLAVRRRSFLVMVTLAALEPVWGLAAGPCRGCRDTAAGMNTPYGDTGCGPRYCGEKHEPSRPDPCDCSNRWRGCNGTREMPDVLAPWQMPPGRGFQSGAAVGYRPGPCTACGPSWNGR